MMRVLIVSVDFPPHTDGVSTVSHELATRLSAAGEEVIVIGPSAKGDCDYDKKQKFKVIRTPLYDWGYLRFIPIMLVMLLVILRYRIKKVIAMNIAYGGIISFVFSRVLGFSYILWGYGFEFAKFKNAPLMRRFYRAIYNQAEFVCAITNFVKEQLVQFGVRQEKIVVIKPGTDPQKYFPSNINSDFKRRFGLEGKKLILSVGRLVERKGFDAVIRAMNSVRKSSPQATYVMVGDGPHKDKLFQEARNLGVSDVVQFAGRVSDGDLFNFYNVCDVFIMPSRTLDHKGDVEGFGIVYLEANACAKPVIGGLDGGVGEAIVDGKTGLRVNPLDSGQVSEAIIKLLSDENYAKMLGENGRKRVVEELNWERSIAQFRDVLIR